MNLLTSIEHDNAVSDLRKSSFIFMLLLVDLLERDKLFHVIATGCLSPNFR